MDGLDKQYTYVLLIGSSSYPHWEIMNIPNVKVNIQELKSLLSDPFYCGIPDGNITIMLDENLEDTNIAIDSFFDSVQTPKATVILYYSGHGLQSVKAVNDLFLTTRNVRERSFEASSIKISDLRNTFSECIAGRKILLLDCCYAGKITRGFMGTETSDTISKLNQFEGTYILAASSEFERARFDPNNPNSPTQFTGEFLDVVKRGIETDDEYCTLNSIYRQILTSFTGKMDAPRPVQISKDNIGVYPLFRNKSFVRISEDEQEWQRTERENTIFAYNRFIDKYPASKYSDHAKKIIDEIEDESAWHKAKGWDTVGGYRQYISKYTKYLGNAKMRVAELINIKEEMDLWNLAVHENKRECFEKYLQVYPTGKFCDEAQANIGKLNKREVEEETVQVNSRIFDRQKDEEHTALSVEDTGDRPRFLRKHWRIFAGLIALAALCILLVNLGSKMNHQTSDEATGVQKKATDSVGKAAPALSAVSFRLSENLLSKIKAFADATPQYNDYFKVLLDSIKEAPQDQQELEYVKRFVKNCQTANEGKK
jgi:hypothetical protein